jgi:gas vesicle protein GvpN
MSNELLDVPEEFAPSEYRASLIPEAGADFVVTPSVTSLTERALQYLRIGYPVHLAGPAGTGKTTLAFHVAAQLGRTVVLIHGNDDFNSGDLVGKDNGYRKTTIVDNYIRSVRKIDERFCLNWNDNRLTKACQFGHTLIYDEFNRTRAEANNALLSVLEEGILIVQRPLGNDTYLPVHPNFRIILTSNPEEYAGVHKAQDALLDRLMSIHVDHYDRETEVRITAAKSGLCDEDAEFVVDLVRATREKRPGKNPPTIRACIAIARVMGKRGVRPDLEDGFFRAVCLDVLCGHRTGVSLRWSDQELLDLMRELTRARVAAPASKAA